MSNNKAALVKGGDRTREVGTQQYIVIRDTDGSELTKPMSWQDASDWVMVAMKKESCSEGMTIAPEVLIARGDHCPTCGEHRDALCDDSLCWNCSPLGAQREPREVEPTFTARAAFRGGK